MGRATRISVSVEKEGYGSSTSGLELAPGPTNRLEVETDCAAEVDRRGAGQRGRAVGGSGNGGLARLAWCSKGATTDTNGHFLVTWNPPDQNNPNYELFLIARDLKRNLAFAQSIDEEYHEPRPALGTGPGGHWPRDGCQGQASLPKPKPR